MSYYSKGLYKIGELEKMTLDDWKKLPGSVRSDIRLALSESIVYAKKTEKERLFEIRSKLIGFGMGG